MKIIQEAAQMKAAMREAKRQGKTIGLVPTMGYLHEGHLSLIRRSAGQNDITAVSIFVNPTQFGANEDLDAYPRDLEHDARVAQEASADVLFVPTAADMYPNGYHTYVAVEDITTRLCGVTRPTHFRGVTTVVAKLFHIAAPDRAYFGQKDFQQLVVIRRMVEDLNMDVELIGCPIVREEDGLAMSSRNTYLSAEQRQQALVLSRSLRAAEKAVAEGERSTAALRRLIEQTIRTSPLADIDYIELVDTKELRPVETVGAETLIALAVRFGSTRLIDNVVVRP